MKLKIDKEFLTKLNIGKLINFDSTIQGFEIDSRKIKAGMAFVALPGENTDGHNYLDQAYENGAKLLIISKDWWQENQRRDLPLFITEDPVKTLQKIAREYRKGFDHTVLCITGSNGKTTTIKMINKILSNKYNVHTTIGNYNNQLGVPLSILRHTDNHNFSVLELGINQFGEMEFLADIAQPTAGLITNIGLSHVEFLKDKKGVAKAKSKLFTSLPQKGLAFINIDDNYIRAMPKPAKQINYGFENSPDYKGAIVDIDEYAHYTVEINNRHRFKLPVAGESFAKNSLAAFAVGHHFGVDESTIIKALENFDAVNSRLNVIKTEYTILDDSYNANPDSTRSAINTLSHMNTSGKKIFIFGDMLELGEKSPTYHRNIGLYAYELGIDFLLTYGDLSSHATKAAKKQDMFAEHFSTKSKLVKELKNIIKKDDIILVKGSRGNKMEDIVREVS